MLSLRSEGWPQTDQRIHQVKVTADRLTERASERASERVDEGYSRSATWCWACEARADGWTAPRPRPSDAAPLCRRTEKKRDWVLPVWNDKDWVRITYCKGFWDRHTPRVWRSCPSPDAAIGEICHDSWDLLTRNYSIKLPVAWPITIPESIRACYSDSVLPWNSTGDLIITATVDFCLCEFGDGPRCGDELCFTFF